LLVRASGLTCVKGTANKPVLVVDDEVYQAWQGLNPTEQYCTLLEAWLLRGHPEIIGERGYGRFRTPDTFGGLPWFLHSIPDQGLQVAGDERTDDSIRYRPGWHNLGLLELFGLIAIQPCPPEPGNGWRIERIHRTPLGAPLVALLHSGFFGDIDNILALESEDSLPYGMLQPTLQPYFPEWNCNLCVPEWAFRQGTHIFKVTLWKGLWRRIAVPADATLEQLASAIVDAIEFDYDHLHMFTYRNHFGVEERIYHSFLDEGPWTDEIKVGDTPLKIGHTMTFLYDFGDQWEFEVALERVEDGMEIDKPVILEARGEPPEQYPGWDDDW
jgi:hypothetical protein